MKHNLQAIDKYLNDVMLGDIEFLANNLISASAELGYMHINMPEIGLLRNSELASIIQDLYSLGETLKQVVVDSNAK